MGSVEGAWERAASQCILRISVRKRASSRAKDSAGSAEGVESLESLVESLGSEILLTTLRTNQVRPRATSAFLVRWPNQCAECRS